MIESPLLMRIVDQLILDHPLRHAFELALGPQPPAAKRDLIVGLFVVAMLIGGWASVALLHPES